MTSVETLPPPYLELSWRALTTADLPELFELRRIIEEADQAFHRGSLRELYRWLSHPDRDLERTSLVGIDQGGTMRAWGLVDEHQRPNGAGELRLYAGIHPLWRRRGVGRAVMEWLDQRASALASEDPSREWSATVLVDARETARRRLLGAAGMTPTAWLATVQASLDATIPDLAPPAGLELAPWPPGEGHHVPCPSYPGQFAAEGGMAGCGAGPNLEGNWSFQLLEQVSGDHVGHVCCCRRESSAGSAVVEVGYVGCLTVAPPWRGRGAAKSLLAAAMTAMRTHGIGIAELSVAGDDPHSEPRGFSSLGFEPKASLVKYSLRLGRVR